MKRILLACALTTMTATASYGQMSAEDLAHAPAASPEAAAKMFSNIGYYVGVLNRCGTPVDMKLMAPLFRKIGKARRQLLFASINEGQTRAGALPPYQYAPGSSECNEATAGYNNAMASIQVLLPLLSKR